MPVRTSGTATGQTFALGTKAIAGTLGVLLMGLMAASVVGLFALGAAIEDATRARVDAGSMQGMAVLDDVSKRAEAYGQLVSTRMDLIEAVEKRDAALLERILKAEFKSLNSIDPLIASLEVTDARGIVVMRGHSAKRGDDKSKHPQVEKALKGESSRGLTVSSTSGEAAQDAVFPLRHSGRVVGSVKVGAYFRGVMANDLKKVTGLDVVFMLDGAVKGHTLDKAKTLQAPIDVQKDAKEGDSGVRSLTVESVDYFARFVHRKSDVGNTMTIGFLADRSAVQAAQWGYARILAAVGALLLIVLVPIVAFGARRFTARLLTLIGVVKTISAGDLDATVPNLADNDEVGQLAKAIETLRSTAQEARRLQQQAAEAQKASLEATRQAEVDAIQRERALVAASIGGGLAKLAEKDLTFRLNEALPEAYQKLQRDFNEALGALEEALIGVSLSGQRIAGGTREIAGSVSDLSKRTEQQAASLEQTAATIDETTSTGRKAAQGTAQVRDLVTVAKESAEMAGSVVQKAVGAMSSIEHSSGKISQIIGVIDEIAFQTNLLALNAGVEAARAGEAGKGFAVVASEVRALAQRSADAAKEIKGLISTSSAQVKEGVDLVAETGKVLQRIATEVTEINGVVAEIAAGAREQATGLEQINTAVSQMDKTTQQNAAMVEKTTSVGASLAQEAHQLSELIAEFRLSQSGPRAQAGARPARFAA
ncbi:MAG: methyl-accepting chemotaxis protein [Hyphomicrobiaceae bacterium]|nr:methyl-accepting chemotaxis protein [Hyphomicrobiaceae bacterium]